MNKIYKFIASALAVALLTLSFSIPSISAEKASPDISKPVNLEWYVIGNGQPEDMPVVLKAVNKYLKDKINATLDLHILAWGDDFEQKMEAKVTAGESFDITYTAYWALSYPQFARLGAFTDLTDMMDTYAPKTKALLGSDVIKGASVDGRLYAIPSYRDMVFDYGLIINKKLATKYKINLNKIKKLEDLEPSLKIIKTKERGITPFKPTSNTINSLNFESIINEDTPVSIKADGKSKQVINYLETPQALTLFSLMNKWYKSGYIPESISMDDDNDIHSGKVFAYVNSLLPSKINDLGVYYNVPSVSVDLRPAYMSTASCTGAMQAISSTSANPERALMFLELMNNDKYLENLVNFGIEKTHYTKTGSNTITITKTGNEKYGVGTPWMFANQFNTYLQSTDNPKQWNTIAAYNKSAVRSSILGFNYDGSNTNDIISNVSTTTKSYMNDLLSGKLDPKTTLVKLNKELKKQGIDKLIKDVQSQVDSYK